MSEQKTKLPSMFVLDKQMDELLFRLEQGELTDEELIKQLQDTEDSIEKKFENYILADNYFADMIDRCSNNISLLQEHKKYLDNKRNNIKKVLVWFTGKYGNQHTAVGSIHMSKSSSVEYDLDDNDVPEAYKTSKTSWSVSKTLIKEAILAKVEEVAKWARIKESNHVVIKPSKKAKDVE